jgi:hypothetical protein
LYSDFHWYPLFSLYHEGAFAKGEMVMGEMVMGEMEETEDEARYLSKH